jgi:hypothetical protein
MKRLVLAGVLVAGCVPKVAEPVVAQPSGECRADAAREMVGKPFDAALQKDAMAKTGAKLVRVIRPGDVVTKDYRPNRLNIDLDAQDVVVSLRCW